MIPSLTEHGEPSTVFHTKEPKNNNSVLDIAHDEELLIAFSDLYCQQELRSAITQKKSQFWTLPMTKNC